MNAPPRPPFAAPTEAKSPPRPPPPPAVPIEEWKSHLRLDLPITEITPLPEESDDATFGGLLPEMSEQDKKEMRAWLDRDLQYAKDLEGNKKRLQKKMISWARNTDRETPWWDLRMGEQPKRPNGRLTILWPSEKATQRARTTHRGRKEIRL
jgi:SWI/SNF-related matrix-associated actin-dependent regulator of chromatin subfamily B protein 1